MEKQYKPYELNVNTLGFYIDRLLYAMVKRQNKQLKERFPDIQHSEFIVLKVLNILEGASQSQLAAVMGKERSGIGRTLASLEKKGYVEREPLNGSTNYVKPSEKGRQLKPLIDEISQDLTEHAFKGFSEKKRAVMLSNLEKIYQNVLLDEE